MDCIYDVCTTHKVDSALIELECFKWIKLFIECVDFADVQASTHLRQITLQRFKFLKSNRRKEINGYVSCECCFLSCMYIYMISKLSFAYLYAPSLLDMFRL